MSWPPHRVPHTTRRAFPGPAPPAGLSVQPMLGSFRERIERGMLHVRRVLHLAHLLEFSALLGLFGLQCIVHQTSVLVDVDESLYHRDQRGYREERHDRLQQERP